MQLHLLQPETHPAPPEYLRLVFCRDIWHCPPEVFYQQSVEEYEAALACLQEETKFIEEQRKKNAPKKSRFGFLKRR